MWEKRFRAERGKPQKPQSGLLVDILTCYLTNSDEATIKLGLTLTQGHLMPQSNIQFTSHTTERLQMFLCVGTVLAASLLRVGGPYHD